MARKRYPVLLDTTDENTNDFASLVRERWMEDTSLFVFVSSIATKNSMAEMPV